MAQIYKIYINEVVLIMTESLPPDIEDYQELNVAKFNFFKFYELARPLESPKIFLLLTPDFKSLFKDIKRSMILIKAAGGIVSNEANKFLFIFRNGKWDLPKGKIEKGENSRVAAIREVQEECGISIDSSGDKICNTYHIYEINEALVIKKTAWYWMRADKQEKLVPQLEEGITDARWLAPGDLMLVRQNTYPLIRDLLKVLE
ncbi:NUDIX hydrolase [Daejeonella rubra]|nr:NUDIX domain-containing protein [Daejeonella rubra]